MKKIDPTELALAYSEMDTDQMAEFARAILLIQRVTEKIGHSAGQSAPTPKRGRPKGSKNREPNTDVELVEKLFGNNAAGAEGL